MPYAGFWGLCALSLVPLGHAVYCVVTATKGKKRQPLSKGRKVTLAILLGGCGAALCGGVVMMLLRAGGAAVRVDEAAVYVMGLVVLLTALRLNGRVRRYLPDMIKEEE